jgi:hypothetical protein
MYPRPSSHLTTPGTPQITNIYTHTHVSQGLPSAARLLAARPYHSGYLLKKRERCLGLCPPQWPPRLFVLAGRFLYRFASERSRRPKGYPIPLEGAEFRCVLWLWLLGGWLVWAARERRGHPPHSDAEAHAHRDRPLDDELLPHCFVVCTLSKEMVLAADSAAERQRWLEQLR